MQASEIPTDVASHRSPDRSTPEAPADGDDASTDRPDEIERHELSRDEIFGILSNPRRRAVIRYLEANVDEVVELRDLAEQLAAWENEVSIQEVTYKQRKRVYTSLYQSHLPKMDGLGIVAFDKPRGTVEATPWTASIQYYLDELEEARGGSRSFNPLGVGAAAGLVLLAALGPAYLGASIAVGAVAAVGLAVLVASAVLMARD